MTKSCTHCITGQKQAPGMDRFFSPANLNRYGKLMSGAVDDSERHQLLEDLDEEMNAFRREARAAAFSPSQSDKSSALSHDRGNPASPRLSRPHWRHA